MNAFVAVSQLPSGVRNYHNAGKVQASSEPQDMRLQRMLGHLPALIAGEPKSVLVVGCGAGVTAGAFTRWPSVKRIVICELEPLVPEKIAPYFAAENFDVVHDSRVTIVHDDARHFLLTTRETFDVITSDPVHPWVRGSAALYVGFPVAMAFTAGAALLFSATGLLNTRTLESLRQVEFIYEVGPFSFIVALLAGAAGMLAMTGAKSASLVGVFISVTTVPAAALAAAAVVEGNFAQAAGSALQLVVNLVGIVLAAALVLIGTRRFRGSRPMRRLRSG
jgi:uncharacterized hydrophobic protein (TIGR00271 family)